MQPPPGYGPYGSPPQAPMQMPPGWAPCSACGRPMNPAAATLSMQTGLPICASCVAGEGLSATMGRAVQGLAYGALGGAVVSIFVTFCLCGPAGIAVAVSAIVSGIRALMLLGRPDYQYVPNRSLLYAAAIVGIVIGGGAALVSALAMMGAVGSAMLRR